ncbi:helix-hairpin-helix domain-containing protein [Enterococcus hulanensis]|uniref:helix-hairpin-helix domain-containing protein n=1 Tax=Enterococcus hulanensis TaxID=2559929 RepID=UPI00289176B3|nr:helix-hairpin-helix domain-containing protein [Enterococcus hulanensis]MDT2659406.1 helix-hairpin-helix domain-containing protein [Enterococcus hulanensis]
MNTKMKKCLLVVVMVFGMIVSFGGNKVEASEKVDINSATIEELQKLDGVGAPLAQKIIDARPYKTVDELKAKVVGIGPAKMKAIQDQGLAVAESFPEKVDINKASLYDLQFLAGVGAPLAQKIIDARPYKTVDELQVKVVGIGAVKMKAIKDQGLAMVNEEKMIKEWFPDSNLASGVAESMGKNVEDIVTRDELSKVTQLSMVKVSRLEGLETLVNLTNLYLNLDSDVSSLNSLSNLFHLTKLNLYGRNETKIDNLSWLSNLKNLEDLTLRSLGLENLDELKELEKIEKLDVCYNSLTNLDGVINCKSIKEIKASRNKITNIDVVRNLDELALLEVSNNEIESIEPVVNLSKLFYFCFADNHVASIAPLKDELNILAVVGTNQIIELPKQTISKGQTVTIENVVRGWDGTILKPNPGFFIYKEPNIYFSENISTDSIMTYNFDVNYGRNPDEVPGFKYFTGKVIIPVEVVQ